MWAFPGQGWYHPQMPGYPGLMHPGMMNPAMNPMQAGMDKDQLTAGGKIRKKKKKQPKGGPKKPATSFVLFSNTVREKVKEENPGLPFIELGKKLGEMWRNMEPEERKKYEDAANAAKDIYMAEKKTWLEETGGATPYTPAAKRQDPVKSDESAFSEVKPDDSGFAETKPDDSGFAETKPDDSGFAEDKLDDSGFPETEAEVKGDDAGFADVKQDDSGFQEA